MRRVSQLLNVILPPYDDDDQSDGAPVYIYSLCAMKRSPQ